LKNVYIDINGRNIRLTKERYEHIILFHPEVEKALILIEETIKNPDYIVQSISDENVELYYHYFVSTPVGDKFMSVVVKLLDNDYFIITVYFTDKIKKGEIKWKKN
jgi:hypothetical protein